MKNFESFGLPSSLLATLKSINYLVPTPIQEQTIPSAMQGKDVLGTAQTGTGKTAAYGIPLIAHLLSDEKNAALVLTPTRELAVQVLSFLQQALGKNSSIKTALIIGGDPINGQLQQLSKRPRLIVGTPGRMNDHLKRKSLKLDQTNFLVLDETDRMLDMGFGIQLDEIVKFLPKQRQTLMFSATLPDNILKISNKYLQNAVRISIGSTVKAADTIKQEIIRTSEVEKYGILLAQLEQKEGSIIVFVKTKYSTEKLADKLRDNGHSVTAIHGDLRQRNREKVMSGFKNRKYRILVATDIAARGLDISHVECVINHDLPQCEEDFIHRIGRTGRAGSEGTAISLITPQDHIKWRNIMKMMDPSAKLDSSFDEPKSASKPRGRNQRSNRSRTDSFAQKKSGSFEFRKRRDDSASPRGGNEFSTPRRSSEFGTPRRRDESGNPRGSNEFSTPRRSSEFGAPRRRDESASPRGGNEFSAPRRSSQFGAPRRRDESGNPRGSNEFSAPRRNSEFGAPRRRDESDNSRGGNEFSAPRRRDESSNFRTGNPRRSDDSGNFRKSGSSNAPRRSGDSNNSRRGSEFGGSNKKSVKRY